MTFLQIGDLARLGGVSVRMLRHYHEIGLLVPERVDDVSGYRWYEDGQLAALHKIVTLKDLGLSLSEIDDVLNNGCDDELGERLMRKREQAVDEATAANERIERIDRYVFGMANGEPTWPSSSGLIPVEVKPVEARRVAQLTGVAESWAATDVGPVIQPMYPRLCSLLEQADIEITGPSTAWYGVTDDGRIAVHATLTVGQGVTPGMSTLGFEIVDLPALEAVASMLHRGPMKNCHTTYLALLQWIDEHGYRPLGYGREIDIECGPDMEWITELQIPVERTGSVRHTDQQ